MSLSRNDFVFIYGILNDFLQESFGFISIDSNEKIQTRSKIRGVSNNDTIVINVNDKNIPHIESLNSAEDEMLIMNYDKICDLITDDGIISTYIKDVINDIPSNAKSVLSDPRTYQRMILDIHWKGLSNITYLDYDFDNSTVKYHMIRFSEIYGNIKGRGDSKVYHGEFYHNNYDYTSFSSDDTDNPLYQLLSNTESFSIKSAFRICFNEIIKTDVFTDTEYECLFSEFIHYAVFHAASLSVNDAMIKHLNSKIPSKNNKAFHKACRLSPYVYGIPTKKQFPMFTKQNVEDAVCLFSAAREYDKQDLAERIYIRAQDFDIDTSDSSWDEIKSYLFKEEVDLKMEANRKDKINYYLDIAKAVSERGTCLRRKYGSVIVKNDRIVSTGYVGAPRGRKNCCDIGTCFRMEHNIPSGTRYEACRSCHSEMNAIISASKEEMEGSVLYLVGVENDGSITPNADCCSMCKRLIINSGIRYVVIRTPDSYRTINVEDWIVNDDSLNLHDSY